MEVIKPRVVQLKKKAVPETNTQLGTASEQDNKLFEAKIKVEKAKANALTEIETFRNIIRTAQEECDKLALFDNVSDLLHATLIEGYLEVVVDPIIKGNKPFGLTDEDFAEARKELFKKLINHYDK